jgi:cytoskeletal protein CcmA (bactofilin family)
MKLHFWIQEENPMSKITKLVSILAVFGLLALAIVTPARAFENREGDTVVIEKDEVVEDDLYVFAAIIVVDGTIKGDLVTFGQTITVNGTVEGDLMAAGQAVVINGEVKDDARIAGAALQVGSGAVIGDDLVAAGASLETQQGSQVGGELVVGSGQALLAGDVTGDVAAGTAALELRGEFGGDVNAYVDMTADSESMPPMNMYMTQSPITIPTVAGGLTVAESAKIAGNLAYTSNIEVKIPSGAVGGKVTRSEVEIEPGRVVAPPTPMQKVSTWALDMLRLAVTLILLGLFLGWLFPKFMKALPENVRAKPWTSLGWGAVAYAVFFFALLVIVLAMVLGGMVFGYFTLSGLSGTIVWVGIVILFVMLVGFVLATSYLSKIVVGDMLGKWLFQRFSPALAEHKFWPMILGVLTLVVSIGLLRFPLLPTGFFGWLANFATILCGLGALWLWGRERFTKNPVTE